MITTIENRDERQLVIQHLCGGCEEHAPGTWRDSAALSPNTSIDYARVQLERRQAEFPKSTYRLIERREVRKLTEEVLG